MIDSKLMAERAERIEQLQARVAELEGDALELAAMHEARMKEASKARAEVERLREVR